MVLRMEDWDELSDFARVVPLIQYGHGGEDLFLRIGDLSGLSLGHGTIVYRYRNNMRLNSYRGGVYARGDWSLLGGEALVDDVLMPSLAVTRVFSRPLSRLANLPKALRDIRVGITVGADFRSPTQVQIAQLSEPEGGHYVVRSREKDILPFLGLDIDLPIWESESLQFVPYADFNNVDLDGFGFHAGLRSEVRFTPLSRLMTRFEYQYAGEGYMGRYVSPFYEIERWAHRQNKSKLSWLREDGAAALSSGRHGFSLEAEYVLSGLMNLMVSYGDTEGAGNSHLMFRFTLPEIKGFRCAVTYANLGFEDFGDLVDSTDTVFAVSARYHVGQHFYVKAQAGNEWWLNQEPGLAKEFETTFNFDLGVGALFTL